MAHTLEINLLGELQVLQDGVEITLPQSMKTRALLAFLIVEGRRQRRDRLCEIFWEVPNDPRAALRWSLSKLRSVLGQAEGAARIQADRIGVTLDTTDCSVDLHRVANLSAKDITGLDTPSLKSLADVFRGPFLEGLELPRCPVFEAWRVFHANDLEEKHQCVLREIGQRQEDDAIHAPSPDAAGGTARLSQFEEVARDAPAHFSQEIRFCKTPDGTRIAFATSGSGPPLLRSAHWMSHLQYEWESPVWRHWLAALSKNQTLVRYDQRGNGLSDWKVSDLSLEAMVSDLESVADASGLRSFPLMGVSQSCAIAIAYAVRHPDRVSHLILYGGFARGWRRRGNRDELATHDAMTTLIREGWGRESHAFRQLFTEMFMPGAGRAEMDWFNELQKVTVSPENASRLHEAFGNVDVSEILDKVSVPTLVLHVRQDSVVPYAEGRLMAAGIARSRFVDLNSRNHLLLPDEPAFHDFIHAVRDFIASGSPPRQI